MASNADASGDDFRFGIEEEYFLGDKDSFEVPSETPDALFEELKARKDDQVARESLQAQIEVFTEPSTSASGARQELAGLRRAAARAAEKHGFALFAAGTHPLARWRNIEPVAAERYSKVMEALRIVGRRNLLCGMHVHVELPDPARRVDVMTRLIPYLPLFVALSASSPFWQRQETGLKSYRMAAYDELPRSGIPDIFASEEDYSAYVAALVEAEAIEDASYIWWMVRPSLRHPTLELRAPDVCTSLDDAIAIACLYRVLVRHLFMTPSRNTTMSAADRAIAVENKWIAQRYGIEGTFASRNGARPARDMLGEVLGFTAEDALALGCSKEIERCGAIVSGGTSADTQLKIFQERKHEGGEAALKAAAGWIARQTLAC